MTDSPGMMLWTDAYLADTAHLTTVEHGAYLLILMAMWRNGATLPKDEKKLARIARMTFDKWKHIAPTVLDLLQSEGELYTQKRLKQEWKIELCRKEKARSAGKLSARARYLKSLDRTLTNVEPELPPCSNQTATLPDPVKKEREKDKREKEDAAFAAFWERWPNKVGKPAAAKSFHKVSFEFAAIMAGLDRYISGKPPDRAWLNPATFLNNRRWEDQPAIRPNGDGSKYMRTA